MVVRWADDTGPQGGAAISSCSHIARRLIARSSVDHQPHHLLPIPTGSLRQPTLSGHGAFRRFPLRPLRVRADIPRSHSRPGPPSTVFEPGVPGLCPEFRHPMQSLRVRSPCVQSLSFRYDCARRCLESRSRHRVSNPAGDLGAPIGEGIKEPHERHRESIHSVIHSVIHSGE